MKADLIFSTKISPFYQAGIVLVLAIIFMSISSLIPPTPYSSISEIQPWIIMCGMILFYAVGNSVLSLVSDDFKMYWLHSIISFALLLVIGGLIAYLFSGVSINDAGSVRWIYIVFTFGYLVFLSIVNLIKFLILMAQRSDDRFSEDK
jgi:hypothetical protein